MNPYTEEAARGAALLDEKNPGWADRIDLSALSMGNPDRCILGQLYGGFLTALVALDMPCQCTCFGESLPENDATSLGFEVGCTARRSSEDRAYAWLENAWRDEILSRRTIPAVAA